MKRWLTCGLVLASLGAGAAQARERSELERAQDLYFAGHYRKALPLVEALASDMSAPEATRVESLKLQAFILFVIERQEDAAAVWRDLLELRPATELDPVEVSPDLITFFGAIEAPPATDAATDAATDSDLDLDLEPEEIGPQRGCGVLLCLVPFGVGQFANNKPVKGLVFALSELAFLGANVGLYWTRELEIERYGAPRDQAAADRSYVLQHVFLALYGVATVAGIVDAFVFE